MRKGPNMTLADAQAHAKKHNYELPAQFQLQPYQRAIIEDVTGKRPRDRMNKTEAEFSRILEAQRQRGEIVAYRYEAVKLRWFDMEYTPDFVVQLTGFISIDELIRLSTARAVELLLPMRIELDRIVELFDVLPDKAKFRIIEVKGGKIWDRDIVRFKGARGRWPIFEFEMWQKKAGSWKRLE